MKAKYKQCESGLASLYPAWLFVLVFFHFQGLTCLAQFSGTTVEGPRTLGKHGFEVAAFGGGFRINCWNQAYLYPRFGLKVGAGITEHFDLKVFYFRHIRSEINDGFNVLQIIPKVSNNKNRFCFYIPVGLFQELIRDENHNEQNWNLYFISPRINGDIVTTRQFDLCLGAYAEIIMSRDEPAIPLFGITAGMGLYSWSRKVFFRTEVGLDLLTTSFGEPIWNFGCTIGYNILSERKKRNISMNHDRFYTSMNRVKKFR